MQFFLIRRLLSPSEVCQLEMVRSDHPSAERSPAYSFCVKEIKKDGIQSRNRGDLFLGCLICGLIGARLWYCAVL